MNRRSFRAKDNNSAVAQVTVTLPNYGNIAGVRRNIDADADTLWLTARITTSLSRKPRASGYRGKSTATRKAS